MLPWQRAPDNATSKYRNNSTLAKNDFGRLFLSRAQLSCLVNIKIPIKSLHTQYSPKNLGGI